MKSTHKLWLISGLIAALVLAVIAPIAFHLTHSILHSPEAISDFSGSWKVCVGEPNKDCREITVPHAEHPDPKSQNFNWLYFSKKFKTPKECTGDECALIFSEIGDAGEIIINGRYLKTQGSLPPHFRYGKHYPAVGTLSEDFLKPAGQMNEIEIKIFASSNSPSGITGKFNGIFPRSEALVYQEGKQVYDIIIPLIAAFVLLIFGAYGFYQAINGQRYRKMFWTYSWSCLTACLYLVFFSEIPKTFMPLWLVSHLHFLFRTLMDWTLFYFIFTFYRKEPSDWEFAKREAYLKIEKIKSVIRFAHAGYALGLGLILASLFFMLISDSQAQNTFGSSLPFKLSVAYFPLKLLPFVLAIFGCALESREKKYGMWSVAVAIIFLAFQGWDVWHFWTGTPAYYFAKFYPALLGLFYLTKVDEIREHDAKDNLIELQRGRLAKSIKNRYVHDIKHPVRALREILSELEGRLDPADRKRLLSCANTFSQTLVELQGEKANTTLVESALVSSICERAVEIKRAALKNESTEIDLVIDESAVGEFVKVNPYGLQSVITNLITNSVEALEDSVTSKVQVRVNLHPSSHKIEIRVTDKGRGMSQETLMLLFKEGASFGKEITGSPRGLGLVNAKRSVESWNGSIQISSELGQGTVVKVALPSTAMPQWMASKIDLSNLTHLVVATTDKNLFKKVLARAFAHAPKVQVVGIDSFKDYQSYVATNSMRDRRLPKLFLVADDLSDQSKDVVALITKHNLQKKSILLTGNLDDLDLLGECKAKALEVLPNELLPVTRFYGPRAEAGREFHVLVDDDGAVRRQWERGARESSVRFKSFSTVAEFKAELPMIPFDTKIFIDVDIEARQDGLVLATDLQNMGFDVSLATGYPKSALPEKARSFPLVGKRPPWIFPIAGV